MMTLDITINFWLTDSYLRAKQTKYSKVHQYNLKKLGKVGYSKTLSELDCPDSFTISMSMLAKTIHINKGAKICSSFARLCEHLPANTHHELYFESWFTTLDLLIYLKRKGILACGTI